MAPEAFVCPYCRTWVEGSGRTIRCSACGKRFRAEDARLDAREATPPEPPAGEDRLFAYPGRDTGEQPDDGERERRQLNWDQHEATDNAAGPEVQAGGGPTVPEQARPRFNLSILFTIAFLALIFVGNRFLSGEVVVGALFALIALQWLLRRSERGARDEARPPD